MKKKKNKALFMINTLSNGGAERVCINMANELIKKGYNVDFILLSNNNTSSTSYELNKNIETFYLNINTNNKILKIFKILLGIKKVNKYIRKKEEDGKYTLITSHLPMTNILTWLSIVKNRSIYVFHLNMSHYVSKKQFLLKNIIKFMFRKKKIIAVSQGVKDECINDYGMDRKYIKTIYNPIDAEEIKEKMNEHINIKDKYFLQVGRLSKQKRQDRMLEVFAKGKFYKHYKLLFCGTGELLEDYKKQAKELGIDKYIEFLGWQTNSYKWMKNAEVMICTSDNEAFPMTLIEALSCGTKIVSSNCKFGPNEILIGDYSDYLVEPDDIDGYIEKINKALKNYPKDENPILKKCISSNVVDSYIDYASTTIKK